MLNREYPFFSIDVTLARKTHHIEMTEGKRNIIQQLFQEYEIETAKDI